MRMFRYRLLRLLDFLLYLSDTLSPRKLFRYRPLWVALGLMKARPRHSPAEAKTLARWARGWRSLAEIGVAEGASALVPRKSMDPDDDLYLIDPFHPSRNPLS